MKKNEICKKSYMGLDGESKKSANENAVNICFAFADGTDTEIVPSDLPENIQKCALLHGLSQKLGDSYAGADNVEDARESFDTMLERLKTGEWVTEKKAGGPRISILVDAIAELLAETSGEAVSTEKRASIAEKVKDKAGRERAMGNPAISARYEKKRADRATEKAQKAADAAEGTTLDEF